MSRLFGSGSLPPTERVPVCRTSTPDVGVRVEDSDGSRRLRYLLLKVLLLPSALDREGLGGVLVGKEIRKEKIEDRTP